MVVIQLHSISTIFGVPMRPAAVPYALEAEIDVMSFSDHPNPKRLLAAARAGNRAARGQLLDFYRAYLILLARLEIDRRLQGKADPADLVQETFLEADRYFAQLRGDTEKEFLSWLCQVLLANLSSLMRCCLVTQAGDGSLENTLAEQLDTSSPLLDRSRIARQKSSGQQVIPRDQLVLLADALEPLPEAYREVIILRHLERLTFSQVARRMGSTVESTKKLWACALARLSRIRRET